MRDQAIDTAAMARKIKARIDEIQASIAQGGLTAASFEEGKRLVVDYDHLTHPWERGKNYQHKKRERRMTDAEMEQAIKELGF